MEALLTVYKIALALISSLTLNIISSYSLIVMGSKMTRLIHDQVIVNN